MSQLQTVASQFKFKKMFKAIPTAIDVDPSLICGRNEEVVTTICGLKTNNGSAMSKLTVKISTNVVCGRRKQIKRMRNWTDLTGYILGRITEQTRIQCTIEPIDR